jgi:hypothetical protein
MGLLAGAPNARTFRSPRPAAAAPPEGSVHDALLAAVRENALAPDPDAADAEPRAGWVSVFDPAKTRFELVDVVFGRYLALSLRVDRKSVNGAYRKIAIAERTAAICVQRGVEKLSKPEREELEEVLDGELFKRALPSVATTDLVWDTETDRIRIYTQADAAIELVRAHFENTFDRRLRPERLVDALASKLEWTEICTRIDQFVPGARGSKGGTIAVDGWHEEDPLEGAHRAVAADFLTWLWLQSESSDGLFRVVDAPVPAATPHEVAEGWDDVTETLRHADLTVWVADRLKLQELPTSDKPDQAPDTTILLGAAPSVSPNARRDLVAGKRPVELRLGLKIAELECALSLAATEDGVVVSGLKLPFEVKDGQEERIFERTMLLDLVEDTLSALFRQFFLARTSPAWEERVGAWLAEESSAA